MKRIIFSLVFALLLGIPAWIRSGQEPTSEDLALKIEEKYNSLQTLSIGFQEEIKSEDFSTLRKFKGRMYLKNPNKFRIEMPSQTVVSDGEYIWVYSKENKQVTKNRTDKSKDLFRPNDYLFNFRKNYTYTLDGERKIAGKNCYRMVYTSKTEGEFFTRITIFFEKETLLAQRIEYQDLNDNFTTLSFRQISPNVEIADSKFVFNAPAGVELIDLTEIGGRSK